MTSPHTSTARMGLSLLVVVEIVEQSPEFFDSLPGIQIESIILSIIDLFAPSLSTIQQLPVLAYPKAFAPVM